MAELSDVEPYRVVESDGKYEVRAPSGRTVMVCADFTDALREFPIEDFGGEGDFAEIQGALQVWRERRRTR